MLIVGIVLRGSLFPLSIASGTDTLPSRFQLPPALMTDQTTKHFYSRLNQSNIPALNGIRALAVVMVILHHLGVSEWELGDLGVIAFFVLSGFLITWLILKESERNGNISIRHFYIRRALRLLPAFYLFCFAYVGIAMSMRRYDPWDQYLAALFYFNDYYRWLHPSAHIPLDHTWSLAVEEQFYLLWPWVCVFCKCNRRKLIHVLLATIVLVAAGRIVYQVLFSGDHNVVYYSFHTRADSLAIGCLLAVLFRSGTNYTWLALLIRHTFAPVVVIVLLVLSVWLETRFGQAYQHTVGLMIWPILLAILMVQLIAQSDRPAWNWIDREPLNTMGRWSYAAYLWHWLVDYILVSRFTTVPLLAKLPLAILPSFGIAALSHYSVERPFLILRNRFRDNKSVTQSKETAGLT